MLVLALSCNGKRKPTTFSYTPARDQDELGQVQFSVIAVTPLHLVERELEPTFRFDQTGALAMVAPDTLAITEQIVEMSPGGEFVISWQSQSQEGTVNQYGIYAQRYNAAGTRRGPTNTATVSYIGNAGGISGVLPDGNYRATLIAAGVTNGQGVPLAANHVFNFFFLNGDANHDGRVNLADFNVLASNFGQLPRNFTQGDFTYDTIVNLADFNVLAGRFGQVLAAQGFARMPIAATRNGEALRRLLEELT